MTQILNVLSREYVVQVADRRLVQLPSLRIEDDDSNKVVAFHKSLVFAYTGLARVGGQQTDYWLMDVLGRHPGLTESLNELVKAATTAFRRTPMDARKRRHAFVGAGYARFSDAPHTFAPALFCVSNFQNGARWLPRARDGFYLQRRGLDATQDWDLWAAGQPLSHAREQRLRRAIGAARARTLDPRPVARLLGETIRAISSGNPAVGPGLLVTMIPHSVLPGDPSIIFDMMTPVGAQTTRGYFDVALTETGPTFLYVPPNKDDGVMYGPGVVMPGGFQVAGAVFGRRDEVAAAARHREPPGGHKPG